jgi:2-aminoadipate transaminase
MSDVIDKYGAKAFQYGATQGVTELREALSRRYGIAIERIQITSSSQQGIDVCTRIMVNPGDVIITSQPSYLGALQSFRSYRAEIVGVAYDEDVEGFKAAYQKAITDAQSAGKRIGFIYTIPDFQNPSGETLPLGHRQALAELAEKYDLVIIEDAPYRELRYEGEQIATVYSLAPERVLHLGSFSKIMAPGFRLGWIFGNPEILDKIYVCKQSLDLCPPVFDQYVAAEFLTTGKLDANLQNSIKLYRHKRDVMLELLAAYMPAGVKWTHPDGGLFLFLTLPEGFDTVKFYDVSLDRGVAYVAGQFFHTDQQSGKNTMRLNFSFLSECKMRLGIPLLAKLIKEHLS